MLTDESSYWPSDGDWRVVVFAFLPEQLERFEELLEMLPASDLVGAAPMALFERFTRALEGFARHQDIKSVGTTLFALARIAEQRIACFDEETSDQEWVTVGSLFDGDSVPATTGRVVMEAISKMIRQGKINGAHPWQALEVWAAETLAS